MIHKYDNSFSEGLTSKEINANKNSKTVDSKACGGHKYKKAARPHTSHTEARIIETIFSQTPIPVDGTLVLAINWPGGRKAGKSAYEPCDHCKTLICAAIKCLTIMICRGKKQDNAKDKCP